MDSEGLADLFWGVARRLRHRTRESLLPWEITPSQARALTVLMRHSPRRLSDLAEHLHIAPRSATEVVDDLQELGLIRRQPDPADRRAVLVSLTDAGVEAGEAIQIARRAEAEHFFATLDAADRDDLDRILRKLRD